MTQVLRTLTQSAFLLVAELALGTSLYAQETWPAGSAVKVIVPFSAGGGSDVLTRQLSERLQSKLGGNWIVENRTGAGGNIGMEAIRTAAPDGSTIGSATIGTLTINQFLFSKLPYDPVADFVYVSKVWENCNVFVVPPDNPSKNITEFLDWAKKRPKGVSYGSAGVGTTPHLAGELFRLRTGIDAVHVPFRGAAQSMPALMAGDTDFAIDNIASYTPLIKTGKVKALAVTCPERWPTMVDVPTMAEAGVEDFIVTAWGAFVLPKGAAPALVNKLSSAIAEIARDPAVQDKYLQIGALLRPTTPRQTELFAEQERAKWKEAVRMSGAKLE
ncbi:tripartite tricarboxylate transporter substrate binding protein [Variovorax sp. J31P207]|uniref:Bug family tripartite tricarboxylate transporter substrate binding protein n=1 Tax=Variovorax sp. J31P207 TaxID=3053510 RepID=UPI0025767C83|nr:tripartite tricarboxylate transporter substrate binding protein [Variovorax sp. J31P207]MDM0069949.1 tripartite tricarboxylate transporter substrate binding protein [Variovorax sp. J31P207]